MAEGSGSGLGLRSLVPASRCRQRKSRYQVRVGDAICRSTDEIFVSGSRSVPSPSLPGTADLVLCKSRIAVYVDGCYWHDCPEQHTQPATNPEHWTDKIARNLERDAETTDYL